MSPSDFTLDATQRMDRIQASGELCKFIQWFAQKFCPTLVWNQEMSLEIDRLVVELEKCQERIRELEEAKNVSR